ncbi:hypothetical protein KSP39_PZI021035 [Platanthera zijinensis]|uniref:Retrovirus-related Pol polyprotein from transposon TNT 1-94-like beta-barrel domain-containing protein n=1 Tax=Platanthera zijinensis TaxID=2320716 RepID=A0AAP0AXA8_9ASPA
MDGEDTQGLYGGYEVICEQLGVTIGPGKEKALSVGRKGVGSGAGEAFVGCRGLTADPTGITNWSVTHVDWSEGKWHPRAYRAGDVTFELLKNLTRRQTTPGGGGGFRLRRQQRGGGVRAIQTDRHLAGLIPAAGCAVVDPDGDTVVGGGASRRKKTGRYRHAISAATAFFFTKFEIPKYDDKIDFGLWQKRIKAVLVQQGLHKALLVKEKSRKKDDEWEKLDLKAINTIQLCLTDEVMYNVVDTETTTDLWTKLEELYMSKSLTNKLYVEKQLYRLRMSESTQLLDHMNAFNKLISQLRSMDIKVEEEDQTLLLLSSLPKSFDHLVTTILYGKDTPRMEEVTTTLLSNKTRSKSSPGADEGLFMKSNDPTRGRSSGKGKEEDRPRFKSGGRSTKCHYCKEEGHWKNYCSKRKFKEQTHETYQAAVASEDENDADVLHVSPSLETTGSWIMDIGCSYHMCPNIEWFSNFRQCESGRVFMGNDSECEVLGVGNIRIKMFDGVVRILTNVRYVPNLRKSLISLGTLEAAGYSYTGNDGYLKVKRGVQIVMKGERSGTLYRLIDTTIAGGRARREVILPLRLQDTIAYAFQAVSSDPGSYEKAIESRDHSQGKARKDQWMNKASFVAKEFAQRKGLDEHKIFAAVEKKGRVSSQKYPDTAGGAIWLKSPTKELRITQKAVEMHSESQSASCLAKDPVYRARTKHIDVRYQESREFAGGGGMKLRKISTENNGANMQTKSVIGVKFKNGLDLAHIDAC